MKQFLSIVAAAVIIYLMYIKGYVVINRKVALAFIGKRKAKSRGATFSSCNGYVKSVIPLETGRRYLFTYQGELTGGALRCEVIFKGQPVLCLDEKSPNGQITAEKGIYTFKTVFTKASGIYYVNWTEIQ